mmetsp:Transcript_3491/g.6305  ORF Transcript_3491/g.6305 Transcript_3491/m.6305 type:complete len:108 (+) Transcript_3491:974-1297(+)
MNDAQMMEVAEIGTAGILNANNKFADGFATVPQLLAMPSKTQLRVSRQHELATANLYDSVLSTSRLDSQRCWRIMQLDSDLLACWPTVASTMEINASCTDSGDWKVH